MPRDEPGVDGEFGTWRLVPKNKQTK